MAEEKGTKFAQLNDDNWSVWSDRVNALGLAEGWWDYVVGPTTGDGAVTAAQGAKALGHLRLHMTKPYSKMVSGCKTGKEAWELLKGIHEPKLKARKLMLLRELVAIEMQPKDTARSFYTRVKEIVDNLELLGEKLSEELVIAILTKGVLQRSSIYRDAVNRIEDSTEKVTLTKAVEILTLGEKRGQQDDELSHKFTVAAFQPGPEKRQQAQKKGKQNGGQGSTKPCFLCNEVGHFKKDCPLLPIVKAELKKKVVAATEPECWVG